MAEDLLEDEEVQRDLPMEALIEVSPFDVGHAKVDDHQWISIDPVDIKGADQESIHSGNSENCVYDPHASNSMVGDFSWRNRHSKEAKKSDYMHLHILPDLLIFTSRGAICLQSHRIGRFSAIGSQSLHV